MVSGGELVAEFLVRQGVPVVFGLCGGHISPIFVAAKQRGIRVVDVRDEASAVFAADAVARLTGVPGVAVVTAGPGVTNTLTALKNAELAQTPVVLLGGAAATILKGRGALQDIDQRRVVGPHVKWAASVRRVRDIVAALTEAFVAAQEEVPGPVFVELPVDVLYAESLVREWYRAGRSGSDAAGVTALFRKWYVDHHLRQVFGGTGRAIPPERLAPEVPRVPPDVVRQVGRLVAAARRPLLLVGSQAMLRPFAAQELTQAVHRIGVPAYCAGMARGLLPRSHRLLMRHERRKALAEADLVMLAGTPADFRLQYGAQINRRATVIAVNRSRREARKNLRPALVALGDVSLFLEHLEPRAEEGRWSEWIDSLAARDAARDAEIAGLADEESAYINPVYLCQAINEALDENSVLVMDGGDFVGTASYIVAPRRPLSFLDPGVFGTLGVGGGFALGAKVVRPDAQLWILYGDGSAAYSLAELDTMVRHRLPVIAVVGNDACWTQIARGQREMLKDDVATVLRRSDYDRVAEGYGGVGIRIERRDEVVPALEEAKRAALAGRPVVINALIGETTFRAGSLSM